jgi:hypothetical protein
VKNLLQSVSAATRPTSSGSVALGILGILLWIVAIRRADFLGMGPLGLVTVLPWAYFAGLAALVIGFGVELLRTPLRPNRLLLLIIGLIVVIFGTASAVEPVARLEDSYLLVGFVQYIFQHGHVLLNFDARFSWPGAFSLGSILVAFTGKSNALDFIRWFPLIIEFLYLPPLLVIAKCSDVGRRAGWLGVALFYASNWIDQDYFSPQALNFLFYLVVVATVLACWKPVRRARRELQGAFRGRIIEIRGRLGDTRTSLTRVRFAGRDADTVYSSRVTLALFVMLGLLVFASAISHQLTPYAIIVALAVCLISRRLGRPELVLLAILFTVGWLSLGATNYWLGHLSAIFGSIGQISSTFGSNVTNRITGSTSHLLVVDARILLIAGLFVLVGIGALRRASDSRTLELLSIAPFGLLLAQNYGGEGLLRVVLYGLPFTTLLAASAVLPRRFAMVRPLVPNLRFGRYTRSLLRLMVVPLVLVLAVVTVVVRGGNDAYEAYSSGELSAVDYAYNHIHSGQAIGMVTSYLPIGQRDVGSVELFVASEVGGTPTLHYDEKELLKARTPLIILSQSQEAWGELLESYPKGWESKLEAELLRHGYRVAARWPTAVVLDRSKK